MRAAIKGMVPPVVLSGTKRILDAVRLLVYCAKPQPWSNGYNIAKHGLIRETLADAARMVPFQNHTPLPPGHGQGIDERCVEYPWLFSHLGTGPGRFLDAGSALNFHYLLTQPELAGKEITILTLAPEPDCFWNLGVSYVFGDLRHAPLRDNYFDTIACLSTLEHVGCDNSIYTGKADVSVYAEAEMLAAVNDMWRMLKPGGRIIITVPFGTHRNYGSFQQFDSALIDRVIRECAPARHIERCFFRYSIEGWQWSSEAEASGAEFVDWICRSPTNGSLAPREADGAAAARAVACLCLTKPDLA